MTHKTVRCAIYTRKSTEEGLDKEFNSLEAQREACESYIKSQLHEGWTLVPKHYDDGGFTGGNMERPALKALMADIANGNVDVIVVYKVDRLSRSLHDFAQMVTVFDAQNVSFVSITQQFNTTTSMGRLTLNILLSFAQFEREVIGERVRDKIAASKKKGMWMGGHPPLGYDIEQRKLIVNSDEVPLIIEIFRRYLEIRSGYRLAQHLNQRGHTNKRWINRHGVDSGGQPFTYQALYKILNNPVYIGCIRHKNHVYEGQHAAIVPVELWEEVQASLRDGLKPRTQRNLKHGTLLGGKCFNLAGKAYTPTYTVRNGVHYCYYVLPDTKHRIKGPDLESLIMEAIQTLSAVPEHWQNCWSNERNQLIAEEAQHRWGALCSRWSELAVEQKQRMAGKIIDRIIISDDVLKVRLDYSGIIDVVSTYEIQDNHRKLALNKNLITGVAVEDSYLEFAIFATFRVSGRRQMAFDSEGRPLRTIKKSNYNLTLVNALVKSYRWNRQLDDGETSVTKLALQLGVSRTYIARIVNLMFLAPDIIASILTGSQSPNLQLQNLTDNLPVGWNKQRELFL